jgi:hypothetical protein
MSAGMSFGLQGGSAIEALACPLFTASQINERHLKDVAKKLDKVDQDFGLKGKEKLATAFEKDVNQEKMAAELNKVAQSGVLFHGMGEATRDPKIAKLTEFAKNNRDVALRLNRYLLEKEYPDIIQVKTPQLAVIDQGITPLTWRGMPVLVLVLLGGFVVNGGWCLFLNLKNKTGGDYVKAATPLPANWFFAALAGLLWCSQFICFKTGEPAMGKLSYIGWSVLMASAILFSTLLGIFLGEWKNTSSRTRLLLALGLMFLVASSVVSGYSGYLSQKP